MATMLIESTDPNFSRYLKKNPNSPITVKAMRQGLLSGWYPNGDPQKYALYFKDLTTENSFSTEDGKNYLDLTQYASTYFVFNAMTSFFNNVLKIDHAQPHQDENGVSYIHKITIPTVQLRNPRTLRHLESFLMMGCVKLENLLTNERMSLYNITLESDGTFNSFMVRAYLLFYLLHADLYASDIVWMEGMIGKVVGMLQDIRAPYFLWYWFKKNVLIKHKFYADLEDKLGKNSESGKLTLQYGDTQTQRRNFVDTHMDFTLPILDVGCGEGDYVLPYAKKLMKESSQYIWGVDTNQDIVDKLAYKLEDRKQTNAQVVTSLDDVGIPGKHDIICIEVIEHMPMEDAKALVIKLMQRDFRKLVITTPNVEFNEYYQAPELSMFTKFRHDDHHFELTPKQFYEFIMECMGSVKIPSCNMSATFIPVGDRVEDEIGPCSMAQAAIITKV